MFASAEIRRARLQRRRSARRVESLRRRIRALAALRPLVGVPRDRDLSPQQWTAIDAELVALARGLEGRLGRAARRYEPEAGAKAGRALRIELGELELRMTRAYDFFDTYMDVLTQRLSPQLGLLLKGCDVLAADGLAFDHPALRLAGEPVVACNRGYGAAVIRSQTVLAHGGRNPLPIVQLPYARLQEKYNLASLLHEVGHEAIVRLRLRARLAHAMRRRLHGHVPSAVRDRYAAWTSELAPDFWAFGCTGAAQAATVRDVLALPPIHAFSVTPGAVHPPVYIRVLIAFHWCRSAYGRGPWDEWERDFKKTYRLDDAPVSARELIRRAEGAIPRAVGVFFDEPLAPLDRRSLVDLFDLRALAPAVLTQRLQGRNTDSTEFRTLRPTAQLAVFRLLRERSTVSETELDDTMKHWLFYLATKKPRGES